MTHARDVFRARELRPYVVYTIAREERAGNELVSAGTYSERVWFRERDGVALARRIDRGVVSGPMIAERPTLNGDVDPGPPTADIFETGRETGRETDRPAVAAIPNASDSQLPVLAAVSVRGEFDYLAVADGQEDGAVRLRLEPRRDPERNRLREIWIDGQTGTVRRFVMRDKVYFASRTHDVPATFAFTMGAVNGVPSIFSIDSIADSNAVDRSAAASVSYRFEDVAFPASLPDWYFDAYSHAKHARDAPNR